MRHKLLLVALLLTGCAGVALPPPPDRGPSLPAPQQPPAAPAPSTSTAPTAAPAPSPSTGVGCPDDAVLRDGPEVDRYFKGRFRANAKTHYARIDGEPAPLREFRELAELRDFLASQDDQVMKSRYETISAAEGLESGRWPEELHNVAVTAYIHAVKFMANEDQDFHIILGSEPTIGQGDFFTAEASGLPPDGVDIEFMISARQQLLGVIGECDCDNHYRAFDPPIPVRVVGSLFFDGQHGPFTVGPRYARTFTAWEIHPVLCVTPAR